MTRTKKAVTPSEVTDARRYIDKALKPQILGICEMSGLGIKPSDKKQKLRAALRKILNGEQCPLRCAVVKTACLHDNVYAWDIEMIDEAATLLRTNSGDSGMSNAEWFITKAIRSTQFEEKLFETLNKVYDSAAVERCANRSRSTRRSNSGTHNRNRSRSPDGSNSRTRKRSRSRSPDGSNPGTHNRNRSRSPDGGSQTPTEESAALYLQFQGENMAATLATTPTGGSPGGEPEVCQSPCISLGSLFADKPDTGGGKSPQEPSLEDPFPGPSDESCDLHEFTGHIEALLQSVDSAYDQELPETILRLQEECLTAYENEQRLLSEMGELGAQLLNTNESLGKRVEQAVIDAIDAANTQNATKIEKLEETHAKQLAKVQDDFDTTAHALQRSLEDAAELPEAQRKVARYRASLDKVHNAHMTLKGDLETARSMILHLTGENNSLQAQKATAEATAMELDTQLNDRANEVARQAAVTVSLTEKIELLEGQLAEASNNTLPVTGGQGDGTIVIDDDTDEETGGPPVDLYFLAARIARRKQLRLVVQIRDGNPSSVSVKTCSLDTVVTQQVNCWDDIIEFANTSTVLGQAKLDVHNLQLNQTKMTLCLFCTLESSNFSPHEYGCKPGDEMTVRALAKAAGVPLVPLLALTRQTQPEIEEDTVLSYDHRLPWHRNLHWA